MEKKQGKFEAFSQKTKAVMIDGGWKDATEAVLGALEKGYTKKGDTVDYTINDDGIISFVKAVGGSKPDYKPNATGFVRDSNTQDQIMRQNATARVVDLIIADKLPLHVEVIESFANGLVEFYKTGKLNTTLIAQECVKEKKNDRKEEK
jgi:hypothetical protein